jgi:hypothetical protein
MNDIRSQLDEYFSYVDEAQGSVDALDVVESVVPLPIESVPQPRSGRGGWLVAAAAAVLVVVLIGGFGLLARVMNEPDSSPVADDPVVTTTQPATTSTTVTDALDEAPTLLEETPVEGAGEALVGTPWLIEDIPPEAQSGVFDTPLGKASWVKLPIDEDTRPNRSCYVFDEDGAGFGGCQGPGDVMAWPSGFAMFQGSLSGYPPPVRPEAPARLWISTNGVEWQEEALPSDPFATGISLTLDNGVYWLLSAQPAALWYTTDGSTWHEVDPTGLAPPRSVDSTWERSYTPPVTAGELTVTYGWFNGDDYPRDHEQSLYIISDDTVTRIEVPWPTVVSATLFSTGDWIYAYTDDSQSREATKTVWRTRDGRSWTEIGTPEFVEESGLPGKSFYLYPSLDGPLVAWSYELLGTAWETTDGLNWEKADLPPLPSTSGRFGSAPVRIGTGWFAGTGDRGGYRGGDSYWMKTGDSWFPLTELQLSGIPMGASGVGSTTFFSSTRAMWVMSVNTTE